MALLLRGKKCLLSQVILLDNLSRHCVADFVIKTVRDLIEKYRQENEIEVELKVYQNGKEVLTDMDFLDILFLDMEMPGMDGIEVGKRLVNLFNQVV